MFGAFINHSFSTGNYIIADSEKEKFILSFVVDSWFKDSCTDHEEIMDTLLGMYEDQGITEFKPLLSELMKEFEYEDLGCGVYMFNTDM